MRHSIVLWTAALTALLTTEPTSAAIVNTDVTDQTGQTVFRVTDGGSRVAVVNRHRSPAPTIVFTLGGATVEQITKPNPPNATEWRLTLGDKSTVELAELQPNNQTTEFTFAWNVSSSTNNNANRELCFHYGQTIDGRSRTQFWYNGYQSKVGAAWPMNASHVTPLQQFNFLLNVDRFYRWHDRGSEQREHILVLEHLFVTSDGFAVMLDPHCPWFIRRAASALLCFSVNATAPFDQSNRDPGYLAIKLRLFAGLNVRTVTDFVVHQSGYLPKPPVNAKLDESIVRSPTWMTWEMSLIGHQAVQQFVRDLRNHSFHSTDSALIIYGWNTDLLNEVANHPHEYPNQTLITELQTADQLKVGFQLAKTSFDHHNRNLTRFLINITSERYPEYIDFSLAEARQEFGKELINLVQKRRLNSVYLFARSGVDGHFLVHDPVAQKYPSVLTTEYLQTVSDSIGSSRNVTIISEYGFKSQHLLGVWVRLVNYENTSYAQLLRELIPNVLSVSAIGGYPLVMPYSVGGLDEWHYPSDELTIRMAQATALMSAMSFTKQPWHYSEQTMSVLRASVQLHRDHVPLIVALYGERLRTGAPIVRPLWYGNPEDERSFVVGDQFMLGDDVLVAPVIQPNQTERMVYFPRGTWIDQHGRSWVGPAEAKVAAPLTELPYFKRKV